MQTLQIVKGLKETGFALNVICYFEYDSFVVTQFEDAGCNVILLNWKRNIPPLKFILELNRIIREFSPSLVHVQYMAPGVLPVFAARLAGIRNVIATVHQPYTSNHGILSKLLLRFSALLCKRFISVSMNAEKSWFGSSILYNTNFPLNAQPNHFTIYNSVEVEEIRQIQGGANIKELKTCFSIPKEKIVVGCVSRLRVEKGVDTLIEAFAKALENNNNIHLLIVGSGPQESELKSRVTELKLDGLCSFTGEANWREAMEFMSCMDIVVIPSRFEGFGLSAAEAMALSKPVIASNVDGLKEVLTDRETGFLFSVGNSPELAGHINKLCQSESLRNSMGSNGFKKVNLVFDIKEAARRNESLYNQLAN